MRKQIRITILTAIFALSLVLTACQKEDAVEEKAAVNSAATVKAASQAGASVPQDQKLELLRFAPDGEVKRLTQIVATFNQPMVALGAYSQVPEGALIITPPIEGTFTWLNQYTLAFTPQKPLTGSLDLEASLDPGKLTALSGATLAEKAGLKISLPPLNVTNSYKSYSPVYTEEEALKPKWQATFNQPVVLESLADRVFYVYTQGGEKMRIAALIEGNDAPEEEPTSFSFSPQDTLPRNTEYALVLEAGAQSQAGPNLGAEMVLGNGSTFGPLTAMVDATDGVYPTQWVSVNFSNPVDLRQALEHLSLDPPYDLSALKARYENIGASDEGEESYDHLSSSIDLPGDFKANTQYKVTITPGLKDIFGQEMTTEYRKVFATTSYSPSLNLPEKYSLLETSSKPFLRLSATNVKEARLTAYALPADEAINFMATAGYYPYYTGELKEAESVLTTAPTVKLIEVPKDGAQDGPVNIAVNLEELVGDKLNDHFIYLTASWPRYNERTGKTTQEQTYATAQVSDIGLAAKIGRESSLIWATNVSEGKSWAQVDLELKNNKGQTVWRGQSDENGLAVLPGLGELLPNDSADSNADRWFVVARAEGQMSLWGVNWQESYGSWRWSLNYGPLLNKRPQNDYWLLSALPIYKPGETAKFKIIARQNLGDQLADLTTKGLTLEIRDANYEVVDSQIVNLGSFGTLSHEFNVPPQASLGEWSVSLTNPGEEYSSHVGSFQVLNYRAPAFEIKTETSPTAMLGEKAAIKIQADYHYGSPVAGQPVNYSVTAGPTDFTLPGTFAEYSIVDNMSLDPTQDNEGYDYAEPTVTVLSGDANLSADGAFDLQVDLAAAPDQKPTPRDYQAFFTVDDVDKRQVSTETGILVHPAELYVGLGDNKLVTEAGSPYEMKLIVADHQGQLVEGQKIKATLYKRTWQNVRRKTAGTAFAYVSRPVDEEISTAELKSAKEPAALPLEPQTAGYYWVLAEIEDDKGRRNQAARSFYVSGQEAVGWQFFDDDSLRLIPDKTEYKPGEMAKIMVQSPFSQGQGLLTVERSGVRRSQVFDITGQSPVLEVPIAAGDAPNVFISVILTRGRVADELDEHGLDFGKPALKIGYVELKIPTKADILTVEVAPETPKPKPGSEVAVTIDVRDNLGQPFADAEVALIAVDAALIQLGGSEDYYPQSHFNRDLPLLVQTVNNIASLMGRNELGLKGANDGGGGADLAGAAMSADGVRRLFSPLAAFQPDLKLDAMGKVTTTIKLPDNLTTFKLYAVATGHGRKGGTGEGSILVTKDLLLRSALPGYAAVGDEFQAAVVVSNRGEQKGQATVTLAGENVTLLEESPKSVDLDPGQSQEVRFRVKTEKVPTAKFLFTVKMGQEEDMVELAVPVSYPNKLTAQAVYDRLVPGQKQTSLALMPGTDLNRGGLALEVAPSLINVLEEPFAWLRDYRHLCVEQTTSKAWGDLAWLALKSHLAADPKENAAVMRRVQEALSKLTNWEYGGAYNFWPNSYNWQGRSVYLTAYVLNFFLAAQEAGFVLPDKNIINTLSEFLKESLNDDFEYWPKSFTQADINDSKIYALAVLSKAGQSVASYVNVFYDRRKALSLFGLLSLAQALEAQEATDQRDNQIAELIAMLDNFVTVTAGEAQVMEVGQGSARIWSSATRTTAMFLLTLCQTEPDSHLIPALVRSLVAKSSGGHFGTTQNNAVALEALVAYAQLKESTPPDLKITASLGAETLLSGNLQSFQAQALKGELPLTAIPAEAPTVDFNIEGQGQAWSALTLKSAPEETELAPFSNGSFNLDRSFEIVRPTKEVPATATFKRGDVVKVTVTMLVPNPRTDVVLEDRVPAGFEPINFNLPDADQTLLQLSQDEDSGLVNWYDHQEIWPDRVAVYASHLPAGVYTFTYLARAVTSGYYQTPGPQAEEMYAPENFGRGSGQTVVVAE